jgi:regulator of RNase E activity RraB
MNAPMIIEFPVVFAAKAQAEKFAPLAASRGFRVQLWEHEDDSDWDVICAIEIVPTHADVVRIQRELSEWAEPFDGNCEGWGTLGNTRGGQPDGQ